MCSAIHLSVIPRHSRYVLLGSCQPLKRATASVVLYFAGRRLWTAKVLRQPWRASPESVAVMTQAMPEESGATIDQPGSSLAVTIVHKFRVRGVTTALCIVVVRYRHRGFRGADGNNAIGLQPAIVSTSVVWVHFCNPSPCPTGALYFVRSTNRTTGKGSASECAAGD